ncbi:glycosyl hydrolase [Lederbergia lenta]|uniref:glycoside hydrolase family 38 N-terminal domain-containing protein n=1 Tax=Lederbergia lenta TaxID=1467 RepID=UPI00203C2151|nr:glycosyl hydrolase [Lederbergia lenta]MCM3109600.1 glycosyl hydrolase [Lederbergia lenta]
MTKKWKIYLIHHSHTDIGYTERQEKIERFHVDYINKVIRILDDITAGKKPEWEGYKYTCENYWQVEQFLKNSTIEEQEKFEHYVHKGLIDISLTYLNLTELVDMDVLAKKLSDGRNYANEKQMKLNSAMTADINGYSWGYAEAMYQNGITNFFSCLHTHHGMFPLYKKQTPFFWETPNGNKVLVWNGDHYQLGNEFMLLPNTNISYQIRDEFSGDWDTDQFEVTEERVFRYVKNLEMEGYPYAFVPAMISGVMTDNAPPNPRMMEIIHRFNEKHGEQIEFEVVTLNQFFEILRNETIDIPTYAGDWPDWWADGVGSTPAPTKIYRDAQRKYQLSKKLDPNGQLGNPIYLADAEHQLMMYAEHTWGYSSSVGEPWNTLVNDLDYRKGAYAVNANSLISRNLDEVLANLGEESLQADREKYFKVINPHERPVTDYTKVHIKHWEDVDGEYFHFKKDGFIEVVDCQTNEILASQVVMVPGGNDIEFKISLAAKQDRLVKVRQIMDKPAGGTESNHAYRGNDGVSDLAPYPGYERPTNHHIVETDHYRITFNDTTGIEQMIAKATGKNLIHPHAVHAPFTGVYEKTPITTDACQERRRMGRNRKGRITERDVAKLVAIDQIADGALYTTIKMEFALEGTNMYVVMLRVYKQLPKIAVTVRIQKQNEWAPENLYIPLPFGDGENHELYAEKTGSVFRPAIDQIPGSNIDFYLLQNGMIFKNKDQDLLVALKDNPLVTLGTLAHHEIELSNEQTKIKNKDLVYSWVMNNFWETNFKVDLSGFYEFDYQLYLSGDNEAPEALIEKCQELNEGLVAFAYNPQENEIG